MLDGTGRRPWRTLFIAYLLALTAFRFVYLLWLCPLDLAQDEAHYWDWSRNLDWSYYSKGPLVAWLIRGSLELFGSLSVALTGGEVAAVRFPALICGTLLSVAIYVLAVQTLRSERTAFFVVLFTSTIPVFFACSLLMTIDSPYVCCWAWALVLGYRALQTNETWAWAATGAVLGVGILAKYTTLLWFLSAGLFLLATPAYRPLLFRRGVYITAGIAALSCIPIVLWNADNGWVSFRHVAGQAGVTEIKKPKPFGMGFLEFIGGQFALLIGWWFAAWATAMVVYRPTRERDPALNYLWWMSLPTIAVFSITSMRNAGQVNWPVAAYISGSVLMTHWLLRAFVSMHSWVRVTARAGLVSACVLGILGTMLALNSGMIRAELAAVAKKVKPNDPFAVRAIDPTCRLRGWHALGQEVDALREQVRQEEGDEAVVAGSYWNMPGEISFYCKGHPTVYTLGPLFGERFNQYDLWRPNPVADVDRFVGKTFIVVNGQQPVLGQAFESAELVKDVVYREGGVPVSGWNLWICRGYRGLSADTVLKRDGY